MVYWFMFKKFGAKDAVSMVRISTPVIYNETEAFSTIKKFVENELFKEMYKQSGPETITMAEDIIDEYGNTGIVAMGLSLLIPLGFVFTGLYRNKN